MVDKINTKFGGLKVTRGREHTYLGMEIKYNENKTVTIGMDEYVREVIDSFSKVSPVTSSTATPAKKNLFDVDDRSPLLDDGRQKLFHHCVAKLLYVSYKCRLDTILTISFLCKRMSCSTEEDWLKLKRLIRYLHGTKERKLTIGAEGMSIMHVLVDAAYAVHENIRSHTGGCTIFSRGAIISKSMTQKLNTKSSTEAELVGCSDYLPLVIHVRLFLEEQGYKIQPTKLLQDNHSTIQLLENGRASAGKKSRHIDMRYFFLD